MLPWLFRSATGPTQPPDNGRYLVKAKSSQADPVQIHHSIKVNAKLFYEAHLLRIERSAAHTSNEDEVPDVCTGLHVLHLTDGSLNQWWAVEPPTPTVKSRAAVCP